MRESEVQRNIIKKLREEGIFAWRVNNTGIPDPSARGGWRVQTGYNMPGMSDILGVFNGKFMAIEVKSPERAKRVSDKQKEFLAKVKDEGGCAFVASCWEDVVNNLKLTV